MSFYAYRQNNSGGSFDFDREQGHGVLVFIEANNLKQANALAQAAGLYFDGCYKGIDCRCCGDRWGEPWDGPEETPTYNGCELSAGTRWEDVPHEKWDRRWGEDEPYAYIHYLDGRIEATLI